MKARAVLFDLDGVLLDSKINMDLAWGEVREQCGVTVPFGDYFAQIGRPFPEILDILGLGAKRAEIEPAFLMASLNHMDRAEFFPGVTEVMASLKAAGVKIALVTSKDAARTSKVLARLLYPFDVVRTPNSLYRGKPAPDHLLSAIAEMQVDPADAVFVGDMPVDEEAARRAGIRYVHAMWGYGEASRPWLRLAGLRNLPSALGIS